MTMRRRSIIFAFFAVFAPQLSLAAMNHGVLILAPVITFSAGLPPEAVGIIGGLIGLGAVWCFAANSKILPCLGPMRALVFGCLLASAALLSFALDFGWFGFLAALLVGFGYAVSAPAGSMILAANTPEKLWGTLFSLRMAGVPAGGAFAGIIAASVLGHHDWRLSLLILIIPSLFSLVFLKFAKNNIQSPATLGCFSPLSILNPKLFLTPFLVLARVRRLIIITFVSIGFAAVQGSLFTFFTAYLTDALGFSLSVAGMLYATLQFSSFAGRIVMGLVSDLIGSPRILITLLGFCSPAGILILLSLEANSPQWLLVLKCVGVGSMIASWNGLFLAEVTRVSASSDVGECTAASTFFTFISFMLAPLIFGILSYNFGYQSAFILMGGFAVVSALVMLGSIIKKPIRT